MLNETLVKPCLILQALRWAPGFFNSRSHLDSSALQGQAPQAISGDFGASYIIENKQNFRKIP
jgi:hypothetical protein